MRRMILVLLLSLAVQGCTHVISKESRSLVDRSVTFPMLRENPDNFKGKYVLVGGTIASVTNRPEGGQLEVVQLPLDSQEMPEGTFKTDGRFLALTHKFLDPLIYKEGRKVTMVGDVLGSKVKRLDQIEYRYPVIGAREIHVWSREEIERQNYPPDYYYPYYMYDPWPYWYFRPGPYRWW